MVSLRPVCCARSVVSLPLLWPTGQQINPSTRFILSLPPDPVPDPSVSCLLGRDERPCSSATETRGLASPRDAMACQTSCEGRRTATGSGTIMLRMLKPDPMPAADRGLSAYLARRVCGGATCLRCLPNDVLLRSGPWATDSWLYLKALVEDAV